MLKYSVGAVVAVALFIAPSLVVGQTTDCAQTDMCLEGCLSETQCTDACIEMASEDIRGVYRALFDCFEASGCDDDDTDCLLDACEDEFVELFDACGGEEDPCVENPGPDCCLFANDDECDEPDLCAEGTDTTDCTNFPASDCEDEPGPDCCEFANDGECDEPDLCDVGTDTTDCGGENSDPDPDAMPDPMPEANPDPVPDGDPVMSPEMDPMPEQEGGGSAVAADDGCATASGSAHSGLFSLLLLGLFLWRRRET